MPEGRILKGVGGLYAVRSESGLYGCRARGLFRKDGITPLPGDNVLFDITDEKDREGYLTDILDRKNCLVRPAVANVDLAFVVVSLIEPEPDLMLVDKLFCIYESKGIEPVLCINKADLAAEDVVEALAEEYRKAGYNVFITDAKSGRGVTELEEFFVDRIMVFSGQSGVGKSTLLNRIMGDYIMETGAISEKLGRGRHTTRHAEFVVAGEGFIVDTPGFSSLDSGLINHEDIPYLFREFSRFDEKCRFSGCMHMNEPDCAVKQAVEKGLVSAGRYQRYVRIYIQAKESEIKRRGY